MIIYNDETVTTLVAAISHDKISYGPFGFEGGISELTELAPSHCLSLWFKVRSNVVTDIYCE